MVRVQPRVRKQTVERDQLWLEAERARLEARAWVLAQKRAERRDHGHAEPRVSIRSDVSPAGGVRRTTAGSFSRRVDVALTRGRARPPAREHAWSFADHEAPADATTPTIVRHTDAEKTMPWRRTRRDDEAVTARRASPTPPAPATAARPFAVPDVTPRAQAWAALPAVNPDALDAAQPAAMPPTSGWPAPAPLFAVPSDVASAVVLSKSSPWPWVLVAVMFVAGAFGYRQLRTDLQRALVQVTEARGRATLVELHAVELSARVEALAKQLEAAPTATVTAAPAPVAPKNARVVLNHGAPWTHSSRASTTGRTRTVAPSRAVAPSRGPAPLHTPASSLSASPSDDPLEGLVAPSPRAGKASRKTSASSPPALEL